MRLENRRGVVLLDALVALTLLASSGLALAVIGAGALRAVQAADRAEQEALRAHKLMTTLSLLTKSEFDQRLGNHAAGEFAVEILRPEPGLYRIALRPGQGAGRDLLVTMVSRSEEGS